MADFYECITAWFIIFRIIPNIRESFLVALVDGLNHVFTSILTGQ